MCHIAPVVKWISQLTSDQLFWVRVLAGALAAQSKTTHLKGWFCFVSWQTILPATQVRGGAMFSAPSERRKRASRGQQALSRIGA